MMYWVIVSSILLTSLHIMERHKDDLGHNEGNVLFCNNSQISCGFRGERLFAVSRRAGAWETAQGLRITREHN
jgi:hypothetical protein